MTNSQKLTEQQFRDIADAMDAMAAKPRATIVVDGKPYTCQIGSAKIAGVPDDFADSQDTPCKEAIIHATDLDGNGLSIGPMPIADAYVGVNNINEEIPKLGYTIGHNHKTINSMKSFRMSGTCRHNMLKRPADDAYGDR